MSMGSQIAFQKPCCHILGQSLEWISKLLVGQHVAWSMACDPMPTIWGFIALCVSSKHIYGDPCVHVYANGGHTSTKIRLPCMWSWIHAVNKDLVYIKIDQVNGCKTTNMHGPRNMLDHMEPILVGHNGKGKKITGKGKKKCVCY